MHPNISNFLCQAGDNQRRVWDDEWEGALVQWLKLPAWKIGDRGFEPHSGLQVSKKQKVFSPLTQTAWGGGGVVFPILCQEGSLISFISRFSGGSPGPVKPICAQKGPKTPSILFLSKRLNRDDCFCHKQFMIIMNQDCTHT